MRRHRVGTRTWRIERTRRAGDSDLPIHFRVVRLELLIRDRPVGETGAGQRAFHTGFLEVDLTKAPKVRREVHARSTHAPTVRDGRLHFGLVLFRLAKGVWRFAVVVREQTAVEN